MIGIVLRVVALILFVVGALNQTLFSQSELDLYGWALGCWVLATLLGGWGPEFPALQRRPAE